LFKHSILFPWPFVCSRSFVICPADFSELRSCCLHLHSTT
jgi:hypothetical protein